jgi:hypothetical protein
VNFLKNIALVHFIDILLIRPDEQEMANICFGKMLVLEMEQNKI